MIIEASKLEEYQPSPQSIQAFNDLAVGSRVHATLLASREVGGSALEVHAAGGHVHVKGRVDHDSEERVIAIVKSVPGVTKVTSDLYSVPPEALLEP
jgi:osmotically-inducible protein OsmY